MTTSSVAPFAEGSPVATPKPTPRKFAPEGVFYVLHDMSVRLPAGILGVIAGTEVFLVKDLGDSLHVTDGHDEFDVKRSQVTNDLELAARVRRASDAAANDDARVQARAEAISVKQQQDEIEYLKAHPLSTPTPSATPRR